MLINLLGNTHAVSSMALSLALIQSQPSSKTRRPAVPRSGKTLSTYSGDEREILSRLRVVALSCRASAHSDLFATCAGVATSRTLTRPVAEQALVRGLRVSLGREPVWFRPGVEAVSFDEAWLLRLIACQHAGEWENVSFLVASRVPRVWRRETQILVAALARACQPR